MIRILKTGIIITVLVLFGNKVSAQDNINFAPPAIAPKIYAMEASGNITVDGKLNESAWFV